MPWDFWATDFISSPPEVARLCLFFSVRSVTPLSFPTSPPLRLALREWQPFHLDLPDWPWRWQWKNPSSVWNVAMVSTEPRPLVAGNRDCGDFLHPSPLRRSPLAWLHATAMWGCIMSAGLLTRSQNYCVQRLHWEHSIFTPLPYAWVGLGGAERWREGRTAEGGRRDDDVDWWRRMRHRTKVT